MSFEPTQPQDGVDPNMFTLIDPEAIPYPLTDVWSLNYAAETLRTGGENLAGGAEDMRSTWQGLQAHYSAPESEALFAKMNRSSPAARTSRATWTPSPARWRTWPRRPRPPGEN